MSFATTTTVQPHVLGGTLITIEADITRGLHAFSIVGLPGKAIEEAKDRIHSAIKHTGLPAPKSQNHKIIISLAPADVKKEGPLFDLPIALTYLAATKAITIPTTKKRIYVGELALDGTLRPVKGVLRVVETAAKFGIEEVIVPLENAREAAIITGLSIVGARNLGEVIRHIDYSHPEHTILNPTAKTLLEHSWQDSAVRLEDIKGQETAKRALIIAAAGRHNVLLVGPPGTGKTMLARAFRSLLPPLSREETLEVAAIRSIAGSDDILSTEPPFRSPHHTASYTALVGGGTQPRPGEVTLAHRGVLFLDEFPEFERRALDALRQPLEDRVVSISRVQGSTLFPADFILIAALNPYRGQEDGTTDLARAMHETYRGKISGPILDRIDLWIEVPHVDYETLQQARSTTNETESARTVIKNARALQKARLVGRRVNTNGEMSSRDIEDTIALSPEVQTLLSRSANTLNLSPRGYYRVIKVARTIADVAESDTLLPEHVLEALAYRIPKEA